MKILNTLSQALTEKHLKGIIGDQYNEIIELNDLDPELAEFIANPPDDDEAIEMVASKLISVFNTNNFDGILLPTSVEKEFKNILYKNIPYYQAIKKITVDDGNNLLIEAWGLLK